MAAAIARLRGVPLSEADAAASDGDGGAAARAAVKEAAALAAAALVEVSTAEAYCAAVNRTTKLDPKCHRSEVDEKHIVPLLITSVGGSGTTYLAWLFRDNGIAVVHEAVGAEGTVGWWQLYNMNQLRVWEKLLLAKGSGSKGQAHLGLREIRERCRKKGGLWVGERGKEYLKPCWKGGEHNFDPYYPESSDHPYRYATVLHQVRDPLRVISSFSRFCGHSQIWKMAVSHTPGLKPYFDADRRSKTSRSDVLGKNFPTCTKLMMYHWWSWNALIAPFADWTYRLENSTAAQICERGYEGYPELRAKCANEAIVDPSKSARIRANSKTFKGRKVDLSAKDIIKLDCELAMKVLSLAVSFGYAEYEKDIRPCA